MRHALLVTAFVVVGCSGGSGGERNATSAPSTQEALIDGANDLFRSKGAFVFSIPSSLPGVTAWSVYANDSGTVVEGSNDEGGALTELALIADPTNDSWRGAAAAVSPELDVDADALTRAVLADMSAAFPRDGAAGTTTGMSVHPLDDSGGGVNACATSIVNGFASIGFFMFGATAGVIGGLLACPETMGAGCVVAVAFFTGAVATSATPSGPSASSCLGQ